MIVVIEENKSVITDFTALIYPNSGFTGTSSVSSPIIDLYEIVSCPSIVLFSINFCRLVMVPSISLKNSSISDLNFSKEKLEDLLKISEYQGKYGYSSIEYKGNGE